MKIEVKKGVLARKLGKDFKDEGFIPLSGGLARCQVMLSTTTWQ